MDTISVLTLRLAEAIGIFMAAIGIGGLIRRDRWSTLIAEFERSPALTLVAGVLAFAIGTAVFAVHHTLHDPLAAVVTIIAAGALIKGLVLIAIPDALFGLARPFAGLIRIWPIAALVIGVALFLLGYTGRANVIV